MNPARKGRQLAGVAMRSVARNWIRRRLRHRAEPHRLSRDQTLLVVAPHPDDEALGCGGLIASHRALGGRVSVVFLTDGAASHRGHPTVSPADLRSRRATEAQQSLKILGVSEDASLFLNLPDGALDRLSPESAGQAQKRLRSWVDRVRPEEIALPASFDGSTEHAAGFTFVSEALRGLGFPMALLEAPIWAWWNPLRLNPPLRRWPGRILRVATAGVASQKARAIACHTTQIKPLPPWTEPVLGPAFVAAFGGDEEFYFASRFPQ